ncbi:hypothetical protein AAHB51_29280 [Bacillus cereus]
MLNYGAPSKSYCDICGAAIDTIDIHEVHIEKETRIQLESELESVNSDISNMKLHLNMLGLKKKKTEGNLDDLLTRKRQIESSLKGA